MTVEYLGQIGWKYVFYSYDLTSTPRVILLIALVTHVGMTLVVASAAQVMTVAYLEVGNIFLSQGHKTTEVSLTSTHCSN